MTNDVISLWDHLDIHDTHLLGISMGGMMIQSLSYKQSKRIRYLILISNTSKSTWINTVADQEWGENLGDIKERILYYFAPGFFENNKLLVNAMAKAIYNQIEEGKFRKGSSQKKIFHTGPQHLQIP